MAMEKPEPLDVFSLYISFYSFSCALFILAHVVFSRWTLMLAKKNVNRNSRKEEWLANERRANAIFWYRIYHIQHNGAQCHRLIYIFSISFSRLFFFRLPKCVGNHSNAIAFFLGRWLLLLRFALFLFLKACCLLENRITITFFTSAKPFFLLHLLLIPLFSININTFSYFFKTVLHPYDIFWFPSCLRH